MLIPKNKQKEQARVTLTDHKGNIYMEQYIYEAGYFRFNWHNCYEIIVVLSGSLTLFVDGSQFRLDKHDVFFINPQQGHAMMQLDSHTVILLMHLDSDFFEKRQKNQTIYFHCQSTSETRYTPVFSCIRHHMANIYMELSSQKPGYRLMANASLRMLYGLLLRHFVHSRAAEHPVSGKAAYIRKLKLILSYTAKNYTEKITLQDLAAITGMNCSYVSTFFRTHMGITYYEHLTRIRLRNAVHRLNNSDASILEIALDSGFPDAKALNAAFKHYFNMTPDRYRKALDKPDHFIEPLPVYLKYSDPYVRELLFQCIDERHIF